MRYYSKLNVKMWNTVSRAGIVIVFLLLCSALFTACDANCNGINNCTNDSSSGTSSSGNTNSINPWPEPLPQSADEIASKLGGDPNDWSSLPPNGWVYRGGPETNSFIVPHWCVVDTSQGRLYPGDQVPPEPALTTFYNVSNSDLAGHSP